MRLGCLASGPNVLPGGPRRLQPLGELEYAALMELIDTHCHLTSDALSPTLQAVWTRAGAAGVETMITVATHAADAGRCIAVAGHYDGVFATIGVHPHEAIHCTARHLRRLRELRHNVHTVAWGEIGLDYHYNFSPRDVQHEVFSAQLEFARDTGLPVVIHCREAIDDTIAMLVQHGYGGHDVVFHCFTGTASEAARIRDAGWRLSFTGVVTFKNSTELQAIARDYPLDELMLETDAPYLTPAPHRSKRPNEPSMLVHTARFLAELKGIALEDIAERTTSNARAFFNLPM